MITKDFVFQNFCTTFCKKINLTVKYQTHDSSSRACFKAVSE